METADRHVAELRDHNAELEAKCAAMESGIAHLYLRTDRLIVAEVCDEAIDKSGALLGRVRAKAAAIAREKEGSK